MGSSILLSAIAIGPIAALLFFILAFIFIAVMLFSFVVLPRFVTPRSKEFGIYIIDCPFPIEDINNAIRSALVEASKFKELDVGVMKAALRNTTVYFHPGPYVVDSFGNKNHAYIEGRIMQVASKDGITLSKTAFRHELAHLFLDACLRDPDYDHVHPLSKLL
jgi:hypothetical protein